MKKVETLPADNGKRTGGTSLEVYHPKAGQNPGRIAAATDPVCREEEAAAALALRIVCEDPTEKDSLADTIPRARRRLKAALSELVRATFALVFSYRARLLLDHSYKKVTRERGEVGRAERSVLALQRLLGRFYVRRLVGRRRLLGALGSTRRSDDEGTRIESLKLAERRYRAGDGLAGAAAEADCPLVRVLLGVRIVGRGEPVWCVRRFVANGCGGWTQIYTGCEADAESILIGFYSEPAPEAAIEGLRAPAESGTPPRPCEAA